MENLTCGEKASRQGSGLSKIRKLKVRLKVKLKMRLKVNE